MADALRIGSRSLILPGRFYAPFGLTLDWSHPLAHRLQSFCVPDGMGGVVDLAKPRGGTGGTRGLRSRGPTSTGTWSVAATATPDLNFTSAPWTVAFSGYLNVVPTSTTRINKGVFVSNANNQGWEFGIYGSGCFGHIFANTANFEFLGTAVAPTVGNHSVAMMTDGTTRSLFFDGALLTSTGSGNMSAVASSGIALGPSDETTDLDLYVFAGWARTLTTAEFNLFHFDPFCMVRSIIPDTAPFNIAGSSGSVAQTLRVLQQTIAGAVSPGGQVAQTLLRPSQALIGGTSVPSDEFFSWRTD